MASPAFLCLLCRLGFDTPAMVQVPITQYTAHYGGTWRELDGALTVARLRSIALNRSKQQSISPLDPVLVEELLAGVAVPLPPPTAAVPPGAPLPGGRRVGLVQVRNGQQAFRTALLQRDGLVCAITGACPAEALQAAHLRPFAKHERHKLEEGLLLRADVHVLFDRGLMAVDPSTKQLRLAPVLQVYEAYAPLDGRYTALAGVDLAAVREHFGAAVETWA